MQQLKILSTGSCLPEKVVTNEDMGRIVETNDEWIVTRTGVRQRRWVRQETNASLAAEAARRAIARAGAKPEDIAFLVVCTISAENRVPSVACQVQRDLGLPESILAFDLNAACSGFLFGLRAVHGLLLGQPDKCALLIGSETLSRVTNFEDRSTCILFGDGAGAVVAALGQGEGFYTMQGVRGDDRVISCKSAGSDPLGHPLIHMDGRDTFRFAVDIIPKCIGNVLDQAGLTLEDIDFVVCHQANQRIIASVCHRMGAPAEKFFVNIDRCGNTSAASIPLALDDMAGQGLLGPGKKVICVGFGGGLTWGASIIDF